jgi:hypothetical protein
MYRGCASAHLWSIKGLRSFMNCQLISAPVISLIKYTLLSLSLDYHSLMCSMHNLYKYLDMRHYFLIRTNCMRKI